MSKEHKHLPRNHLEPIRTQIRNLTRLKMKVRLALISTSFATSHLVMIQTGRARLRVKKASITRLHRSLKSTNAIRGKVRLGESTASQEAEFCYVTLIHPEKKVHLVITSTSSGT